MGMRAGFVYKTEDDLIGIDVPGRDARNGAYTVPFTFVDIGVDGVRGTADDQQPHALRHPDRAGRELPARSVRRRTCRSYSRYKTVEVVDEPALQQQVVGVGRRRLHAGTTTSRHVANSYPQNPNQPGVG